MLQGVQSRSLSGADAINALRPFYFAVHPDFFGQHPKERVKISQYAFFVNVSCVKDGDFLVFLLSEKQRKQRKIVLEWNIVITREQKDALSLFLTRIPPLNIYYLLVIFSA